MAGWKLKAVIVTLLTLCALPVIFRRHSKCNLSSVINQLVSKALNLICSDSTSYRFAAFIQQVMYTPACGTPKIYTGKIRPKVQNLTLLYTILTEKVPLSHTCFKEHCFSFLNSWSEVNEQHHGRKSSNYQKKWNVRKCPSFRIQTYLPVIYARASIMIN